MVIAPTMHGPMLCNPNDAYVGQSLLYYGEFSYGEWELFAGIVKPGDTVVDAGANIGAHTVPFARAVLPGVVHALEPQRLVHQTLCANIALNQLLNVHTYREALGADHGTVRVPVLDPSRLLNFGGLDVTLCDEGDPTPVRTLDSMALSDCALMKIDVEGMELDVLFGAHATIERCRPVLYVEADRDDRKDTLIEYIRSLDYGVWWHRPPLYREDNYNGKRDNIWVRTLLSHNLLCIPRESDIQKPNAPEATTDG